MNSNGARGVSSRSSGTTTGPTPAPGKRAGMSAHIAASAASSHWIGLPSAAHVAASVGAPTRSSRYSSSHWTDSKIADASRPAAAQRALISSICARLRALLSTTIA